VLRFGEQFSNISGSCTTAIKQHQYMALQIIAVGVSQKSSNTDGCEVAGIFPDMTN